MRPAWRRSRAVSVDRHRLERILSTLRNSPDMDEQPHTGEALIDEIARYLAAVDLFRTEQCEPSWRSEPRQSGWLSPGPVAVAETVLGADARPH
jgi:hypothetical protein